MDIKTKFSIGDDVVAISEHRLRSYKVAGVVVSIANDGSKLRQREHYTLVSPTENISVDGCFVFSNREELIRQL